MNKLKIEIKWAFIYAGMTLLWGIFGKLMGLHDNRIEHSFTFNTLILIPSFIVYLLEAFEKRKAQNNRISFKQAIISGLLLTAFITVLGVLTTVIFSKLISPDFFEKSIQYVTSNKMMTEEQAIQQFNTGTFIIQGIIGAIVSGILFSLITSAIIKKKI